MIGSLCCIDADGTLFRLRCGNATAAVARQRLKGSIRRKVFDEMPEQRSLELALEHAKPWLKEKADFVLTTNKGPAEAESFILQHVRGMPATERTKLVCCLIQSYGRHGLWQSAMAQVEELRSLSRDASSQAFKALLQVQAEKGDPFEAEKTLRKMQAEKLKPSPESYKTLLFSFGRCALFDDMKRLLEEMTEVAGYKVDAVTFTMILSAYGTHRKYQEMLVSVQAMQASRLPICVRCWNVLCNSCPSLAAAASKGSSSSCEDLDLELSTSGTEGELLVVRTLMGLRKLPPATVVWSCQQWKLDVHSLTPPAAYLVLLCWLRDAKKRLIDAQAPAEMEIVTGWGKHSTVRGTSQVKNTVSEFLRKTGSPFRRDRQNKGRLVCRGNKAKQWLLSR